MTDYEASFRHVDHRRHDQNEKANRRNLRAGPVHETRFSRSRLTAIEKGYWQLSPG